MSEPSSHGGHLDATAGREVVFCHACRHEWYRDEYGLICPQCQGEITEIITLENDPREFADEPSMWPPEDGDSDPEEADIDEQGFHGPNGFTLHRTIWSNSLHPPGEQGSRRPTLGARSPTDPSDGDAIIHRFIEMVNGMNGGPLGLESRSPTPGRPGFLSGPNIRTTTFTSGGNGRTTFTIATGPIPIGHDVGSADDFRGVFHNMLSDMGPPHMDNNGAGAAAGAGIPPPGLVASLQDLLGFLNPANARHGDAVYTQEALDRIITSLMEANPQSNAAPPASEDALKNLERKAVDGKMLETAGGKPECTICIDEMKKGDQVAILPCKHWFHDQCVIMWLKEHNTCPICRTAIESNDTRSNRNHGDNGAQRGGQQYPSPPRPGPGSPLRSGFWGGPRVSAEERGPAQLFRSGPDAEPRLSDTIRNMSSVEGERERRPYGFARPPQDSRSRRDSYSPRNSTASPAEPASRASARTRSPSGSSRRSAEGSSSADHGGGPLSWLRDHFGSGSGSGSNRERRRP